jgi:hypothetical protein
MKPSLVTNQSSRPNRHAHIRKPQFDRHLLACGHFSGHYRAHAGFADVGAAPR